jgi:hypothetical protein
MAPEFLHLPEYMRKRIKGQYKLGHPYGYDEDEEEPEEQEDKRGKRQPGSPRQPGCATGIILLLITLALLALAGVIIGAS